MDPINNNGMNNYSVTVPQQQENDVQVPEDDYSSMPMVYDPEAEEKKKAASNMTGLAALGTIAAVGIGYGINRHMKAGSLKKEVDVLKAEKETIQNELTAAKDKISKLENPEKKSFMAKIKAFFKRNKKVDNKAEAPKASEAAKAEEKAAEETK